MIFGGYEDFGVFRCLLPNFCIPYSEVNKTSLMNRVNKSSSILAQRKAFRETLLSSLYDGKNPPGILNGSRDTAQISAPNQLKDLIILPRRTIRILIWHALPYMRIHLAKTDKNTISGLVSTYLSPVRESPGCH